LEKKNLALSNDLSKLKEAVSNWQDEKNGLEENNLALNDELLKLKEDISKWQDEKSQWKRWHEDYSKVRKKFENAHAQWKLCLKRKPAKDKLKDVCYELRLENSGLKAGNSELRERNWDLRHGRSYRARERR
jgi:chromosome segregation ATPase